MVFDVTAGLLEIIQFNSHCVTLVMDCLIYSYSFIQPDQWENYYQQKYCSKPPGESASDSILRLIKCRVNNNDIVICCSCPGHRRMSQGPIIPTEALAITKPKRRRVEDPQKSGK